MNKHASIRKSLQAPYRYDKTNNNHAIKLRQLIDFLIITPILCLIFGFSIPQTGIVLKVIAISILPVILAFRGVFILYNKRYSRYYRIVKKTVEQGENNIYSFYSIQEAISSKQINDILTDLKIEWKFVCKFTSREEAEIFFDQKTIKKVVDEVAISEVRKSIRRPAFFDLFMEMHQITRLQLKPFFSLLFFIGVLLFLAVFATIPLSFYNKDPSWVFFIGLPLLLCIIGVYLFYIKTHRYHRLISRTVTQGRYKDTSVYIQSFLTRKKIKNIGDEKDRKWKDFYIKNNNWMDYKENASFRFNEDTIKPKITEELL